MGKFKDISIEIQRKERLMPTQKKLLKTANMVQLLNELRDVKLFKKELEKEIEKRIKEENNI